MQVADAVQQELLIARLSEEIDIDGFEQQEECLIMYINEGNFDEKLFKNILELTNTTYLKSTIKNENWNKLWESSFEPVIIGDFVSVRADFHREIKNVEHEIVITPKMSFGTGHHATTSMMLESLQQYSPVNKAVIDFGTGTGVLAILSEKMYAKKITAIDCDDWSIENAAENFERNHCKLIVLKKADRFPVNEKWDIILANINLNIIKENMEAFAAALNKDGRVMVSGILKENKEELLSCADKHGFTAESIKEKNNWLCVAFKQY